MSKKYLREGEVAITEKELWRRMRQRTKDQLFLQKLDTLCDKLKKNEHEEKIRK